MIFKKNIDRKLLQKFHSQQKKTNKLISMVEKYYLKDERNDEQFNNIYKTASEIHSIIIEETGVNGNGSIQNISLLYFNFSDILLTLYFTDHGKKDREFYNDFLKNILEIFEVFEGVIFHIVEHPNIARESFGKKDLFLHKIYQNIGNSVKKDIDPVSIAFILNCISNISFCLKKIIY